MNRPDMNNPYALTPVGPTPPVVFAQPYAPQNSEDINFLGLLDTARNARWLIISTVMTALLIGGAYALFSQPIYQSDALIQVEQNGAGPTTGNLLSELSSIFNVQTPATAEIEILRSRLVVGEASDKLQLYVEATPNYVPIVGRWLAKHATGLSNPRLLDLGSHTFGGYVWGRESIEVAQLDVPQKLENMKLTLTRTPTGYTLRDPDGELIAKGTIGAVAQINAGGQQGRILVSELNAKADARFTLIRRSRQNIIQDLQDKLVIDEKGKPSGVLSMSLNGYRSPTYSTPSGWPMSSRIRNARPPKQRNPWNSWKASCPNSRSRWTIRTTSTPLSAMPTVPSTWEQKARSH